MRLCSAGKCLKTCVETGEEAFDGVTLSGTMNPVVTDINGFRDFLVAVGPHVHIARFFWPPDTEIIPPSLPDVSAPATREIGREGETLEVNVQGRKVREAYSLKTETLYYFETNKTEETVAQQPTEAEMNVR